MSTNRLKYLANTEIAVSRSTTEKPFDFRPIILAKLSKLQCKKYKLKTIYIQFYNFDIFNSEGQITQSSSNKQNIKQTQESWKGLDNQDPWFGNQRNIKEHPPT